MAINPKQIEEWRKHAAETDARYARGQEVSIAAHELSHAFWALLAEREERARAFTPYRAEAVRQLDWARARMADALSLLRETEWGGACENLSDLGGPVAQCPACGRLRDAGDGHAPDCRLAALLRGSP
jgi:hypothetical protein